ncbi:MAG: hypothetical protein ACUVSQ_08005 [Pseudanabaenaceae cyanobacterium]
MNTNPLTRILQYLSDAIARIFSPSRDNYPATGPQPYTGNPNPHPDQ